MRRLHGCSHVHPGYEHDDRTATFFRCEWAREVHDDRECRREEAAPPSVEHRVGMSPAQWLLPRLERVECEDAGQRPKRVCRTSPSFPRPLMTTGVV